MLARIGVQSGVAHRSLTLRDERLDLLAVGEVLGQPFAGRVEERAEHDPAAPLRMALEQVVEGEEAPQQVLRQLDAVDPHDQGAVAHCRVEIGQGGPTRRSVGHGPDVVRIGGQRGDEGARGRAQDLPAAGGERVGPAAGVEPAGAEPGHPFEQLDRDGVGQHPQLIRPGERGVGEVHRVQIGTPLAEHRSGQREVVVLHQHGGAVGRILGHRVGEGPVDSRGRHPTRRRSACRTSAFGPARTARGARTRAWRCRRRRRRRGRRRGRAPAGGRGTRPRRSVPVRRRRGRRPTWRRRSTTCRSRPPAAPGRTRGRPRRGAAAAGRARRARTRSARGSRPARPLAPTPGRSSPDHAPPAGRTGSGRRPYGHRDQNQFGGGRPTKHGGCTSSPRLTSSGARPTPPRWPPRSRGRSSSSATPACRCRWPTAARARSTCSADPTASPP